MPQSTEFSVELGPWAPLWMVVGVALIFATWWLYRRTTPPIRRLWRYLLATLRCLAFAGVILALLSPVISLNYTRQRLPRTQILVDVSHSMAVSDGLGNRAQTVRSLLRGAAIDHIAETSDLSWTGFGIEASPLDLSALNLYSLKFEDVGTAIGTALLQQRQGRYLSETVILISDGANTTGPDPVVAAGRLGVPIHVLAVGDERAPPDLRIVGVNAPQIAVAGESIEIAVTVANSSVTVRRGHLKIMQGGRLVARKTIRLPAAGQQKTEKFTITPPQAGVARYTAVLDSVTGEITADNNLWAFGIDVLSGRTRVSLIANAPSPDVAWLARHISSHDRVESRLWLVPRNGRFSAANPLHPDSLAAQKLVVVVDLAADVFTPALSENLAAYLDRGGSLLLIGQRNRLPVSGSLAQDLPVELMSLRYRIGGVTPQLNTAGLTHPIFADDLHRDEWTGGWTELPPLLASLSGLRARKGGIPLLSLPREPLMVAGRVGRGKVVVAGISSFWRWDMLLAGQGDFQEIANRFWGDIIRWLTAPESLEKVRITTDRPDYLLGETITFDVQTYDGTFNPLDGADVTITAGSVQRSGKNTGSGHYRTSIIALSPGEHTASVVATYGGNPLGRAGTTYRVSRYGVEQQDTRQRRELLEAIAVASGGSYTPIAEADSMLVSLNLAPVTQQIHDVIEPGRSFFLLVAIAALLIAEWIGRKIFGMP